MENTTGIHPIEFKVLVLPDDEDKVSAGGIHIPEITHERQQMRMAKGTLIDRSEMAFAWGIGGVRPDDAPAPGDRILYVKYSGEEVYDADGQMFRVMNDKDVIGTLD